MPRLSILIPVLGDPQQLDDTLVSVLQNRPDDCQVIVALNRAYDDPYDLKGEVEFVSTSRRANFAHVLCAGWAAVRAPVVHTLACGMEATPDWTAAACAALDDEAVAAVAPLVVEKRQATRIVSAGVRYTPGGRIAPIGRGRRVDRARVDRYPTWPEAGAAFYRRSAVEAVGGFCPSLGTAAGMDLALRLMQSGYRAALAAESRIEQATAAGSGSSIAAGWQAESLFWRWAPLDGWFRALTSHVAVVAAEAAAGCLRPSRWLRLVGRCAAASCAPMHRGHWRELAESMRPMTVESVSRASADAARSAAVAPRADEGECRTSRAA